MSRKSGRSDLLVKVRFQNPLPAPPCPPKLLDVPTDARRYARADFLDGLAHDAPLPLIVDADCGLPLDLARWESLWSDVLASDGTSATAGDALNPDPTRKPVLDPRDQALLLDPPPLSASSSSAAAAASSSAAPNPSPSPAPYSNGDTPRTPASSSTPFRSVPSTPSSVTWLRKTEYLSRDTAALTRVPAAEAPPSREDRPDVSREAQLRSIDASFAHAQAHDAAAASDLGALRHPTKRGVHAVASFDLLPDVSIWANEYDLFRFSERPGERGPELDDPRLDCAIMRPMESDGEHFLAYYLAADDDAAAQHRETRTSDGAGLALAEGEHRAVEFHFVRDYEVVKVEQDVPNEFLLVFGDGPSSSSSSSSLTASSSLITSSSSPSHAAAVDVPLLGGGTERRRPGAYYKTIERKMLLKKKRTEPLERFQNKWSLMRVHHEPPGAEEAAERADALAEVLDPEAAFMRVQEDVGGGGGGGGGEDADGEGEVEVDADGVAEPDEEFVGAGAGAGAGVAAVADVDV